MNVFKNLLGFILFAIINTIYIKYFGIMGITPNIGTVIIVLIGSQKGSLIGASYGLFLGLLNDILIGTTFGLYGLIYLYIGFFAGTISNKVNSENTIILASMIGASNIIYNIVLYSYYYMSKEFPFKYDFGNFLIKVNIPEALYTVAVFIFLNFFIRQLIRQFNRAF